jgi:act minimal PKS chain-length factor (CLF/KS beta)
VGPDDVDAVFADASGIPEADVQEAAAIKQAFGQRAGEIPVTAPKTMVGRLYAGGASLDVAAALLGMRDGRLPPTINLDEPADECDLRFVTGSAEEAELGTVLVLARGFGGFNSALVLRRDA